MEKGDQTNHVKIAFLVGGFTETIWAVCHEDGTYEIANSPFDAYGISYRDIIAARLEGERLVFDHIVRRSGHSTYRIRLNAGADHDNFLKHWPQLALLGCTFEGAGGRQRLYSIDVPKIETVPQVYAYLEKAERDGVWEFEEAHYFVEGA